MPLVIELTFQQKDWPAGGLELRDQRNGRFALYAHMLGGGGYYLGPNLDAEGAKAALDGSLTLSYSASMSSEYQRKALEDFCYRLAQLKAPFQLTPIYIP